MHPQSPGYRNGIYYEINMKEEDRLIVCNVIQYYIPFYLSILTCNVVLNIVI